jgi:UPF0042 nucleotide-binding protein
MKSFEDLGFYCIDNLPPALAPDVVRLAAESGVERLALALDVRAHGPFGRALDALATLRDGGTAFDLLYLEAGNETIVRRYSETRRRHPLDSQGALSDAIERERKDLASFRAIATHVIDTSALTHAGLKAQIASAYAGAPGSESLAVHVIAFGFKFGLPLDADLVFDVRLLPNPYYVPELKELSGLDAPVADFLAGMDATQQLLERLSGLIDFLIPGYIAEGKSRLTIAIGCTGGQHRSVYVAERLGAHLRDRDGLSVHVEHRELAPV